MLFLEGPAGLNRVEVGRVCRQVQQADTASAAPRRHARVMMGPQVVHDHHVAGLQPRQQVGGEPRDEPLGVGGGKHGPQHHPAVEANRADQCQGLAPIHGHGVDEFSAALHPGVTPTHRGVDAGLVHKDQTIDGDCTDAPQEPAPLGADGWPRHLRRPPPFFLTT